MRILSPENSEHSPGEIIAYVIVVLYFIALIYYIYRLHLLSLFQMFMDYLDDNENQEQYKTILYSCLNSLQYLILCFYATFSSESDLAVSTIIGSDAFIIFFVFSLILYLNPTASHGVLDTWVTIKDVTIYVLTLFVLFICIMMDFLNFVTAIFLLVIYFTNIILIFNSENAKAKMMDWLNLTAEDDDYSCEQHLTYVKRRVSITFLKDNNYVNVDDPTLIKKLALNNKASTQKSGSNRLLLQKLVYIIIFAMRNQVKQEKQFRVDFYNNMYKPKQRTQPVKKSKVASSQPDSHSNQMQINEDQPLIDKGEAPLDNQEVQEQPQIETRKLKLPEGKLDKVLFIIFFPAHLICHFIPKPKDNADYLHIALDLFLCLAVVTGLYYLIDWWVYEIFDGTGIPIQVLGIIFLGPIVSAQLAYFQLDNAKNGVQMRFLQGFLQTAICKSALCIGLPWGIQSLINVNNGGLFRRSNKHSKTFSLVIIIFGAMMTFLLFQCYLKRFILGKAEAFKYMILYVLFLIVLAVIIPVDVLK